MTRYSISLTLVVALLLLPFSVFAQSASCSTITQSNFNTCCTNVDPKSTVGVACTTYYYTSGAATSTANGAGTSGGQTPGLSNNTPGVTTLPTTTTGLSGGAKYTPQVTLNYGSNNSFGGLSFKGVGAALVSCTGFGNFLAGAVTDALNVVGSVAKKAGSAVVSAISGSGIPIISGIGKRFGSASGTEAGGKLNPYYVIDTKAEKNTTDLANKAACLDGIAYVLSQQVLQQITNRTLHWANTGFGGNPLYIKDIDSYLLSLRNQQINSYLQSAQSSDPIFGNALRSIVTLQVTGHYDGLLNTSLNNPQSQAYNSFMSNFTNGGWNAFSNPAYNPIGALFNASDKITTNVLTTQQNSQNELQRNSGFLDMKTCVQYADGGQVANNTKNGSGLTNANTPANSLSNKTPACLKYQTVTPGSIVALQVANITNSPVRQAELATQFNEAVGSFFDALLTQLFYRGLSGIKGTPNQADLGLDYGGLGSNDVVGADGQVIADINANQPDINDLAAKSSGAVDISHPQFLRAIIKTQYDYLNAISDSRVVLNSIAPKLGQLDYCVPGPNPSWQDSLQDNFTAYVKNTQTTALINILAGGGITNKNLSLYDKFGDGSVPIADRTLSVLSAGGFGFVQSSSGASYLQAVHDNLTQYITAEYSRTALGNAYAGTTVGLVDQAYARGMANDMYDEVSALPTIAQNAIAADQAYAKKISDTQNNIQSLEAINNAVLKIVTAAKARYVAAQKAAGTPVKQACLDAEYTTDSSAITGAARQESDAANPMVQQFLNANKYFYTTL